MFFHKRLLKLFTLRAKEDISDWKLKSINRVLKKEKEKLTKRLDDNLFKQDLRPLNPMSLTDKKVISLFDSSGSRALDIKTNELCDDVFVLSVFFFQVFEDVVKKGFIYNGKKYIFLTASAGQIRVKKGLCISEEDYDRIKDRLTCGLSIEQINEKGGIIPNKYLAYSALSWSATEPWLDFDIDKSIVVDDFETNVFGTVDFVDSEDYSITRKDMEVPIPHSDGFGIMLQKPTRMIRAPFVKGLLVYFPFDRFLKEKCLSEQYTISDIYGVEHNIVDEGIQYIFTKSQFKMAQYYNSWEEYKTNFKEYGCEVGYCNAEGLFIPKSKINYQMLQTLSDMSDDEIAVITAQTHKDIDAVGNDFQTTMRLLGATSQVRNKDYYQQALEIYPELMRDQYGREIIKQTKRSLIKQAKSGRLKVDGRYQFVCDDPYAFCEWLFLGDQNPKGLLADGEVYSGYHKDDIELACLRSPHLYREWAIRINRRNEELDKWFGDTKCIYTSCHDLISKMLQFDCDGDKLLVLKDKKLINVAKRNMQGVVPLYYNMRKGKAEQINAETLYHGMALAYTGGNIGPVSNNITKIWNCGNIDEQALSAIKWLCMTNNEVIDYAKTLYRSTPPKDVAKTIQSYTKLKTPNFFQYAKDKDEEKCEKTNNSTMNRISDSFKFETVIFSKTLSKFDYRMLLSDKKFGLTADSYKVLERYDYWNRHKASIFNLGDKNLKDDNYAFLKIRSNIIDETGLGVEFIANSLVKFLYQDRKNSLKKLLWSCFGDVLVENLKKNTEGLGKICQVCGKRFKPNRGEQNLYCSTECYAEANRQKSLERWREQN